MNMTPMIDIVFQLNDQRPPVNGWITGFKPNLIYADGRVPRVDVVHLHHGVWLNNGAPTFAAGEEKTEIRAPFDGIVTPTTFSRPSKTSCRSQSMPERRKTDSM